MGREDVAGGSELARLGQSESSIGDEVADLLQDSECRMAFVDVPNRGGEPEADERPHPADAKRDLLADPHLRIAGVEPRRDVAVVRVVLGKVRVEQVQGDLPHLREPDQEPHAPVAELEEHGGRTAVGRLWKRDGEFLRIEQRIGLVLPALEVDRLAEVAFPVEESDSHERKSEIVRRLQEVSREDAEPAGVDRKRLG